jgi:hypothetical protein
VSPFFERKEEGGAWKLPLALVAGFGALTAAWLLLSRPEESRLSGSRAFDQPGGPVAPRVPRAVERREGTGLTMVHTGLGAEEEGAQEGSPLSSVAPGALPGPAAAPAPEPAPQAAPRAAPAAAAKAPDAASEKELAAAGIPVTPSGLKQLGAQKGLLSAVVKKMIDHPRVLKAVLDNKLVVDALMSRDTSRRNCSDPNALKSVLSDPNSSAQQNLFPLIQQALSRPESASAMLSSRLGQAIMDCPSTKAVTSDPQTIVAVAMSNPKALQLASDPRVAQALTANPQAAGMFGSLQSGLGGLGQPR